MSALGGRANVAQSRASLPLQRHSTLRASTSPWTNAYPFSRHHQSRDSRRARVPSAGWSGRDLRSAIVRHRFLSLFMFSSAAFRSATCCSARSARRCSSASGVGPLGVSEFDGARDDAAVASVCMRLACLCKWNDAGNGALVRLIAG